jgi:hypothetical protein
MACHVRRLLCGMGAVRSTGVLPLARRPRKAKVPSGIVFAEFERAMIRERVNAGLARAMT